MPSTSFKLSPGFKKLEDLIKPSRTQAALNRNVGRALQLNGKIVERAMRRVIQGGMNPPNANLTIHIKGSTKPLVDHADLMNSIRSVRQDELTVFIGILRTSKEYDIATVVHNGAHIPVTPKMRGMFFALWLASNGDLDPGKLTGRAAELWQRRQGGWFPLKDSTTHIVIPPRKFVEQTFRDKAMKRKLIKNFKKAAALAFTGKAKA